ncbi:hypothetical protein [Campylobacter hyointestinalis]|uniref:hypothetical protein n=1 Tax=Campylobacter hyointestinalis TaxID=198 RepID=UPI000727C29C|nr:hypothetical protein [Campylobacter hyointestinalis]CUU69518.1 Uncharacterised protein [Campylobacter hyointestinalis subsp. hyointestinalis]
MVVDRPLYKSLDILNKYKNELTKEQFDSISSIIYGFAIDENIYLNEKRYYRYDQRLQTSRNGS